MTILASPQTATVNITAPGAYVTVSCAAGDVMQVDWVSPGNVAGTRIVRLPSIDVGPFVDDTVVTLRAITGAPDYVVVQGTGGGSGTVTATAGALTANALVLGAGTTDTKVSTGITSDGASQLNLGVNVTTAGKIKMFGGTSGDATIKTAAAAGTAVQITLPAVDSTLATLGANTLTDSQIINAGTKTTSSPIISGTQTWNAGAVPFDTDLIDITDTASASGSFLIRRRVGGVTKFSVAKDGSITTGSSQSVFNGFSGYLSFGLNCNQQPLSNIGQLSINNSGALSYLTPTSTPATIQIGAVDAASAIAQTLRTQGPRANIDGNVPGVDFSIYAGPSNGLGTPAAVIIKSTLVGSTGSVQQTLRNTFTVQNGSVRRDTFTFATLPTNPTQGDECNISNALAPTWGTMLAGGGSVFCGARYNGTTWVSF